MDTPDSLNQGPEVLSQSEVERLLAQVAQQETNAVVHQTDGGKKSQPKDAIQPYDFRHPVFLSPTELRKLRVQHESFIRSLAARLSIYLRLDFGIQMSQLQTLTYQKFTENLANPCHLTLFKVEPLRGICVLDINLRLGLTIVDRLMGGAGNTVSVNRDLSEIEIALLDQAIQLIIAEWADHWSKIQDLRPLLLGHENNGRFLQTSPPDAVMLALSMEARMGDCVEQIQIGFPYATIEPLIRKLSSELDSQKEISASAGANGRPKWKRDLDSIEIPVAAELAGLTMTARDLTRLKIGSVLPLSTDFASHVRLRLARMHKFNGRLGTRDKNWAVELTSVLKTENHPAT